jgi:regulator of protease activity HflC (stomatin/prohibitin superfamily)
MLPTARLILFGFIGAIMLGILLLSSYFFDSNEAGEVSILQTAVKGNMKVIKEPGTFSQMFGDIHKYKISNTYSFDEDSPIPVRFGDAANATITGQIKYRLPMSDERILALHVDFRSEEAVQSDLIRRSVDAAIRQTASMFKAEEVYSTRRAEFVQLVNEQIKNGIYATQYIESSGKDEDGNRFIERTVIVKRDAQGVPIVSEASVFKRYGIELVQLVISDPDFDDITDQLIAKRKEAEQEQVVAKANAERAKQDTITATEKGKAEVAKAEAAALVEKKTAVINAEREKEVAEQNALKAVEEKKKIIALGEAEAEASRLKVAAGLTPLEKAQIDKDTAIGVAEKLAGVKFPSMLVIGGGANGSGPLNPFDAVGLKALHDLSKEMTKPQQ